MALLCAACGAESTAPGFASDMDPSVIGDASRDASSAADGGVGDGGQADGQALDGDLVQDADVPVDDARAEESVLLNSERLLIAEANASRVHAYDGLANQLLESFTLAAPARVLSGGTGRFGYAQAEGEAQLLSFDMGLSLRSTSQGAQAELQAVRQLAVTIPGQAARTLLAQGDHVAVLFAGTAQASLFQESTLLGELELLEVPAGAPHQGVAVRYGERVFTSYQGGGDAPSRLLSLLPSGLPAPGTPPNCPGASAAALAAGGLAMACEGHVLRWAQPNAAPEQLEFPAQATPRLSKLVAHPREAGYLGSEQQQLCLLREQLICRQLPVELLEVAFDADGKRALALGADGLMYLFDPSSLEPRGTLQVTSALSPQAPLQARPHWVSGHRFLYVSDPDARLLRVVHANSATVVAERALPFPPSGLALFKYARSAD